MKKSEEISLIFPFLNGDRDEQIAAVGPIVDPQLVIDRMTWAVEVFFSSSTEFEMELRRKEPLSTFFPTLIAVLATQDALTYELWERLEKMIAYNKIFALAARTQAILKHYDICMRKGSKSSYHDKEYKFPHQDDWIPTDKNWLPMSLAASVYSGGLAKRVQCDGIIIPEEAKEAVRTGIATYSERQRLKYERENERQRQQLNNKRQRNE